MKRIIVLLQILALIGCGTAKIQQQTTLNPNNGPQGVKGRIATAPEEVTGNDVTTNKANTQFTSPEDIKAIMQFLASDEMKGRDSGSEEIEKAADFIKQVFVDNGIAPYFESYRDTLRNFDKTAFNVVGYIQGSDTRLKDEYVILGAHYDHIGMVSPDNGDAIANGANDNASGTAMVLELARYFGKNKNNKRSIIFALFSAEEKGLMGSKHLASKLSDKDLDLYTTLNFEMVGVPMVDKNHLLYLTGFKLSNLAEISNKYAGEQLVGFLPKAKEFNLFKRSDNYPFHEAFRVPSQTYSTFDFTNYGYYHKAGDENSEMDFTHMANVANKLIPMVTGIVNANNKEIKYN
ncbi:M28 family metallopeptidase [Maribacter aestuarii]|uniref:M28 family metallopeptidase n=1 Tax=Maribacter aestuarii TaxID=1130723 RepID=UPI00248C71D4|nr:M20/M25/M40 family metallo-hydrolase [Maribacter aestuarii]